MLNAHNHLLLEMRISLVVLASERFLEPWPLLAFVFVQMSLGVQIEAERINIFINIFRRKSFRCSAQIFSHNLSLSLSASTALSLKLSLYPSRSLFLITSLSHSHPFFLFLLGLLFLFQSLFKVTPDQFPFDVSFTFSTFVDLL